MDLCKKKTVPVSHPIPEEYIKDCELAYAQGAHPDDLLKWGTLSRFYAERCNARLKLAREANRKVTDKTDKELSND